MTGPLPPTRASNSVTARPPPGPGSTAALRAGSPGPGTPRPARRSRLARQPTTRRPGGPSPSGTPSQPSPTTAASTTREDPGRRQPTRLSALGPDSLLEGDDDAVHQLREQAAISVMVWVHLGHHQPAKPGAPQNVARQVMAESNGCPRLKWGKLASG